MLEAYFNNIPAQIMTVGALVGVGSSLLGTFLVLRKNSLLSDAISHSILLGIVVVFLITGTVNSPLQIVGAALAGVLTVVLTELLTRSGRVKNDAAIGLVFPALFALAVILINLYARNVHLDADAVLLGEIAFVWLDTLTLGGYRVPRSLVTMAGVTLVNLAFVVLFFKELKLSTFDEALAKALGFRPAALFYALLTLTSVTAVSAFDAVGAILLIAFVIVPPAAAYLLTDRLWLMMVYGGLISVGSSLSGYYLAVLWDVSIGGMMASMTGAFLLLAFLFGPRYGLIAQEFRRQRQRFDNEKRALVVHLYNHESSEARGEENVVQALRGHLRWSERKTKNVLLRSLDSNLITRSGNQLNLTPKGRVVAQEIMEPWRQVQASVR